MYIKMLLNNFIELIETIQLLLNIELFNIIVFYITNTFLCIKVQSKNKKQGKQGNSALTLSASGI